MSLLLFLTGLSTVVSTAPAPPASALRFEVGGNTVQSLFPESTVISSYAPITFPTNR